jgi:hypothetical protein
VPDEFTRHGRGDGSGWAESQPPRSQSRAAAAAHGETPGRKPKNVRTPKKECTASPDGMHHGEPRLPPALGKNVKPRQCKWMPYFTWRRLRKPDSPAARWSCYHMEYCRHCNNKMNDTMDERCPAFPGDPEQKKLAEQETARRIEEMNNAPVPEWKRRKIPDGKQSYRKRKGSAGAGGA